MNAPQLKDGNYVTILGWMVNRLGLSSDEAIIYAIVYGFSQDKSSSCELSIKYAADWIGKSQDTARRILQRLTDRGLIEVTERRGGANLYRCVSLASVCANPSQIATPCNLPPLADCQGYPSQIATPTPRKLQGVNNIYNNNNSSGGGACERECAHTSSTETTTTSTTLLDFQSWWMAYAKGSYKDEHKRAKDYWLQLTPEEQEQVKKHSAAYIPLNDERPKNKRKHPLWYLTDEIWKGEIPVEEIKVYTGQEADAAKKAGMVIWNCKLQDGKFGLVDEKQADALGLEKIWKL